MRVWVKVVELKKGLKIEYKKEKLLPANYLGQQSVALFLDL